MAERPRRGGVRLEVEPPARHDPEEDLVAVEPPAAEHRERAHVAQSFHLLEHVVLEALVAPGPPGLPAVTEVDAATLWPAVVATNLAIAGMGQVDAEMLADFRAWSAARAGTRFFAVELDGVKHMVMTTGTPPPAIPHILST